MDKLVAYFISLGITSLGLWLVTLSGSPIWPFFGSLVIMIGLFSLYDTVRQRMTS
jgi:hypothetical protein